MCSKLQAEGSNSPPSPHIPRIVSVGQPYPQVGVPVSGNNLPLDGQQIRGNISSPHKRLHRYHCQHIFLSKCLSFAAQFFNNNSAMNSQYLMYRHVRKQTPYESYIKKKQQVQQKKQRYKYYEQILQFKQSRYPQQLMAQLQREINPFQLSIDKLKEFYNSKFPQYSNELVHEAVQYVFKRKCQESDMVRQNSMVIEVGNQSIRNGRKLQFQDFSYMYDKGSKEKPVDLSISQNQIKGIPTDRQDSINSKIYQEIQAKTDRFNKLLEDELNRQKGNFQNLQLIEEGDPRDLLFYKQPTSRRDPNSDSFPKFREADLIVKPETGLQTGRSDLQQLNHLLGGLTLRGEEEQIGDFTGRSRGSSYTVKIKKQVMENLYNARGKLKLELVRRVVNKFKKDK